VSSELIIRPTKGSFNFGKISFDFPFSFYCNSSSRVTICRNSIRSSSIFINVPWFATDEVVDGAGDILAWNAVEVLNSGAGDAIDVRGVGDFDGGGDFSCFILFTPKL